MLEAGAGVGLVLMLRWYWWRVNAWSEITALVAPAVGFAYIKVFTALQFPETLIYLVTWTTAWWLFVTFLTPPEPEPHLVAFYRRVRPGGPGWKRIAVACRRTPARAGGRIGRRLDGQLPPRVLDALRVGDAYSGDGFRRPSLLSGLGPGPCCGLSRSHPAWVAVGHRVALGPSRLRLPYPGGLPGLL